MAFVHIAPDGMRAVLALEPAERIEPAVAHALLRSHGVVAGVQEEAILEIAGLTGPTESIVAVGTLPRRGASAVVTDHFPSGPQELTPTIGEDGRADFRDLGLVCNVAPGAVLAEKTPAQPGIPGCTVLGVPIPAKPGFDAPLLAGAGAVLRPDGLAVLAAVPGSPSRVGKQVLVSQQYSLPGDVDLSTGHVRFEGDVEIKGGVQLQMEVAASGNVTIYGSVEGATVRAGGRLVVHGGVRSQAHLEAGTDVIAKFIEKSNVRCGGSLGVREDLLYSEVVTQGSLVVNGALIGGSHQIGEQAQVRTLGARLGTPTNVALVPYDPQAAARAALTEEMEALHQNQMRIEPRVREAQALLRDPLKAANMPEVFRKLLELSAQLSAREGEIAGELEALAAVAPPKRPRLAVREAIHPGVSVQIRHAHARFTAQGAPGALVEEAGTVRLTPL